jgi:hypothetical protein
MRLCVFLPCCTADLYFKAYGTVARGNPNYFITYGNGKSGEQMCRCAYIQCEPCTAYPRRFACRQGTAHFISAITFSSTSLATPVPFMLAAARVQQGLRPNGAHRWHSYVKTPK